MLMTLLNEEIPSANVHLRHQVLNDVILRLEKTIEGIDPETCNINNTVVANIKNLLLSLEKYGGNNREQIKFKKNIAIVISGTISMMRLKNATGLSRRIIDHDKSMRILFGIEIAKAIAEEQAKIDNATLTQSNEINSNNGDESDEADSDNDNDNEESDHDDEQVSTLQGTPKRSSNGEGKHLLASKNRYRSFNLLCPQIERNEFAIRISEDEQLNIQDSYRSKINTQKSKNLAVAVENKIIRDENFAQVVPRKVSV